MQLRLFLRQVELGRLIGLRLRLCRGRFLLGQHRLLHIGTG